MRLRPTISFAQYRDACLAAYAARSNAVTKRSWKVLVSVCLACLAVGFNPEISEAVKPALVFFAVVTLGWIFCKPLAKHLQNRRFRKIYAEMQTFLNAQLMTIDESGITCDIGDGKITTCHTWAAFTKRIDLPDAYVFLSSPNSFIRVPKQTLSLSDIELVWQWSWMVPIAEDNKAGRL